MRGKANRGIAGGFASPLYFAASYPLWARRLKKEKQVIKKKKTKRSPTYTLLPT